MVPVSNLTLTVQALFCFPITHTYDHRRKVDSSLPEGSIRLNRRATVNLLILRLLLRVYDIENFYCCIHRSVGFGWDCIRPGPRSHVCLRVYDIQVYKFLIFNSIVWQVTLYRTEEWNCWYKSIVGSSSSSLNITNLRVGDRGPNVEEKDGWST